VSIGSLNKQTHTSSTCSPQKQTELHHLTCMFTPCHHCRPFTGWGLTLWPWLRTRSR